MASLKRNLLDSEGPSPKLSDVLAYLGSHIPNVDWMTLRRCSWSLCSAVETTLSSLHIKDTFRYSKKPSPLPDSDQIRRSLRGILQRRGPPQKLTTWFRRLSGEEAQHRTLDVLSVFTECAATATRAASSEKLLSLTLSPPLLTREVAAALCCATSSLASLNVAARSEDDLHVHDTWDLADIPGLPILLRSFHFSLWKVRLPVELRFPSGAVEALRGCSTLEELSLVFVKDSCPANVLAAVAELPVMTQLRSLRLSNPYREAPTKQTRRTTDAELPATTLEGLSALTGLTELRITVPSKGLDISSSISGLRGLHDLCVSAPLRVEHLVGLTKLTHLQADHILVPAGPSPAGAVPAAVLRALTADRSGSSPAHYGVGASGTASCDHWPLPPRLQTLSLEPHQPLTHLARLAAPESLKEVNLMQEPNDWFDFPLDQITFPASRGHALPAECTAAIPGAVNLVKGRLDSGALLIRYTAEDYLRHADPRVGHGPWLAALAPLALRQLILKGVHVDASDMLAIAKELGTLEMLSLMESIYALASLPSLARLPRLKRLGLGAQHNWPELEVQDELAAALGLLFLTSESLSTGFLLAVDDEIVGEMTEVLEVHLELMLARHGRSVEGLLAWNMIIGDG